MKFLAIKPKNIAKNKYTVLNLTRSDSKYTITGKIAMGCNPRPIITNTHPILLNK